MEHASLTETIIGGSMKVHRTLGSGFLESVYANALAYELTSRGLHITRERRLRVHYEGAAVGEFVADLLVEDTIPVEVKAVRALTPKHEAQVVNYLTAIGLETGLLINFGADELQFKRKARTYRPPRRTSE
jgi:GxxExxY protein